MNKREHVSADVHRHPSASADTDRHPSVSDVIHRKRTTVDGSEKTRALHPVRTFNGTGRVQVASALWTAGGILFFLVAWALLTSPVVGINDMATAFSPANTLPRLFQMMTEERVWFHIGSSLKRIAVGLFVACIVGVPLGIGFGSFPRLERAGLIPVQFLRMISPLSWMPIAVMMMGIGDTPIYFLLSLAALWPIVLNTAEGVKRVDLQWMEMVRSLGATPFETLRFIVFPAILNHGITGLRLGLGMAWVVLVPAEMLGVRAGLGYAILDARDRLAYSELMAIVLLIGFIGWLMDAAVRSLERNSGQ